jgi:hypothetical protein
VRTMAAIAARAEQTTEAFRKKDLIEA